MGTQTEDAISAVLSRAVVIWTREVTVAEALGKFGICFASRTNVGDERDIRAARRLGFLKRGEERECGRSRLGGVNEVKGLVWGLGSLGPL